MNYFFQNYIDTVKSFSFKGRATRKQYWLYTLFQFFIFIIFIGVTLPFQGTQHGPESAGGIFANLIAISYLIYLLATAIQSLAITTRRLHDANLSGWWQLLMLLPYLGNIILLVLVVLPSKNQPNRFGPLPEQN